MAHWTTLLSRGTPALRVSQEPVQRTASVNLPSGDRSRWVIAKRISALAGACARARSVEAGDRAMRGAQEAVIHTARIHVISDDLSRGVDALGQGALDETCARPGSVDRCDGAIGSA